MSTCESTCPGTLGLLKGSFDPGSHLLQWLDVAGDIGPASAQCYAIFGEFQEQTPTWILGEWVTCAH